jgi:hypothetical protein
MRKQGQEIEKEKPFLFPTQEMEAKTQNGGPHLLGVSWMAEMMVKTGRGHFGPQGDFLDFGHCVLNRDFE